MLSSSSCFPAPNLNPGLGWLEAGREQWLPDSRAMTPSRKVEDEGLYSEVLWEFELYFINKEKEKTLFISPK